MYTFFFSLDIDKEMTKSFVTCVRLFALSKYQGEECTPIKIKDIIRNDYFKLYVIEKWADIDMCIPGRLEYREKKKTKKKH